MEQVQQLATPSSLAALASALAAVSDAGLPMGVLERGRALLEHSERVAAAERHAAHETGTMIEMVPSCSGAASSSRS